MIPPCLHPDEYVGKAVVVAGGYRDGMEGTVTRAERSTRGHRRWWFWLRFAEEEGGWYSEEEVVFQ